MSRIERKFRELKQKRKKAFVAFLTAGYPTLSLTKAFVLELERKGVDIIELGVPFSDPLADGPVIQVASQHSLKKGINLDKILALVKSLRYFTQIPICLMTYYNPVFIYGVRRLIDKSEQAGVDGLIIPDLPPEEAGELITYARKKQIDSIFFLSPTSSLERVKYISRVSRGFIYYVSLTGVTGEREKISKDLTRNIYTIKKLTSKPLCVGFGISKPQHVKAVSKMADGVIVGSAIVKRIGGNLGKKDIVKRIGNFVKTLTLPLVRENRKN